MTLRDEANTDGVAPQTTAAPAGVAPVPDRFPADADLVRRLIDHQFPQWADRLITPVASAGWDNHTFHLGADMMVRLPSAAPYALAVEKEHRWLPLLRSHLPLPIPTPLAQGQPGEGYPYVWSVYGWLPGAAAHGDTVADLNVFAGSLAGFLRALRQIDASDGPDPGQHNWFRGGSLATYDKEVERALDILGTRVPPALIREIWDGALDTEWGRPPVWFHGDVASGNLLVENGVLSGVIDFGTCGIGDPACDVAFAWTFLSGQSRDVFRAGLDLDSATWARGRGWAMWKALIGYARAVEENPSDAERQPVVDEIIEDYTSSRR